MIGNKILVLGCPGSGKSTLARKLRDKTGLPLIHLDNIWWRPDGTHISQEEFDRRLEAVLRGERWILDGLYRRTCEVRLRACDTVLFLDYSEAVCMQGLAARVGKHRADMPWTETELDPELVAMVRSFHTQTRPALLALLDQYAQKPCIRFQNRAQADAWLSGL